MIDDRISPYTDADVVRFRGILRLGPEKHDTLAHGLDDAAREWHRHRQSPLSQTSAKARSDELRRFAKRADAMAHALSELSDAAWLSMQYASDSINSDRHESRIDTVAGNKEDSGFDYERSIGVAPDRYTAQTVSYTSLQEAVRTLARLSDIGSQILPDLRKGPSRNYPLECWIRRMMIVSYAVGVRFTRNVADDGSPTSPAAYLCVAAYSILAPETPPSRVVNTLKHEIASQLEMRRKNK